MQEYETKRLCDNVDRCCSLDKVQYALDLEAAISTLEARLNEERICETMISHTIQTLRDFHDADCVLVIAINAESMSLRCVDKVHREGIISSIVETIIMPAAHELVPAMLQIETITMLNVCELAKNNAKVYQNLELAGFNVILAAPYGISNRGLIVICNPKKYAAHGSLLRMTSYVIGTELMMPRNSAHTEYATQIREVSNEKEVYVKLQKSPPQPHLHAI